MKEKPMSKKLILAIVAISLVASGCIIVVKEGEWDAEWASEHEHQASVRGAANTELSDRVSERLAEDSDLRVEDLSVTAADAVVTLHGRVGDVESLRRAVELAGSVDGVRRVVSRVTVDVRSG